MSADYTLIILGSFGTFDLKDTGSLTSPTGMTTVIAMGHIAGSCGPISVLIELTIVG